MKSEEGKRERKEDEAKNFVLYINNTKLAEEKAHSSLKTRENKDQEQQHCTTVKLSSA